LVIGGRLVINNAVEIATVLGVSEKIIGITSCILEDENFRNYAAEGYKKYIASAYFANGTSNDLHHRDALHYHVSGLKPCLTAFINMSDFDPAFDLYAFEAENGASIKKSVEYSVPYATGEKQRKEWVDSKVELDKKKELLQALKSTSRENFSTLNRRGNCFSGRVITTRTGIRFLRMKKHLISHLHGLDC
jgi:hypothetical protein